MLIANNIVYIIIGVILGLDNFLLEKEKNGYWKINIKRLVFESFYIKKGYLYNLRQPLKIYKFFISILPFPKVITQQNLPNFGRAAIKIVPKNFALKRTQRLATFVATT
jgi:hypothetical protein